MTSSNWVRRLLPVELRLIRQTSFLRRVPMLRRLGRQVTARLTLFDATAGAPPGFRLDFETPYLHLPVEVDQAQIGAESAGGGFSAAAFRYFDWQSWVHMDGDVLWHGERRATLNDKDVTLITGFSYRPRRGVSCAGNLGLRVAEGVEGTVRVASGGRIFPVGFEPGYWMLEPEGDGFRVVPIRREDLLALIVSLSEIGSGNPAVRAGAVEHLWQWVSFHHGIEDPEHAMLKLLKQVRDWGPLAMPALYEGLVQVLDRLQVKDPERVLFEFYADHWGVRDNRNGRLLAVNTLHALATDASRSALGEILSYVRNRGIPPDEIAWIRKITGNPEQPDEADRPRVAGTPPLVLKAEPVR